MTYSSLMVHMELGRSNAALLRTARDLAQRFQSKVIGIAAWQPMQMYYADGYSGDMVEQEHTEMVNEVAVAEAEFRAALQKTVTDIEWRSTMAYALVSDYLAREARAADLVLTCVESSDLLDSSRAANTGDLVMQVGRPVLIVPPAAESATLDRVLIGWKDTRETRRAIVDALPILAQASHVTIAAVAREDDMVATRSHLADVAGWLLRHGVVAEPVAAVSTGGDATALDALAQDLGADLIVAGAYGHSRLREWVLGGVTKDLLLSTDRFSLVSH